MRHYYEELWQGLPDELSLPDYELRLRFLLEDVRPGLRVLDLGCGEGGFAAAAAGEGAEVIGVEVAQAAVDRAVRAHPGLDFQRVEIDGPLPFEDGAFELVWASEVIEHVADTARWLSEVRRVLAVGGLFLVTTPSHGRLRVALGGIERFSEPLGDHLHLYTRRSLADVLGEFGFEPVSVRAVGGPPLLRRMLLGRARR